MSRSARKPRLLPGAALVACALWLCVGLPAGAAPTAPAADADAALIDACLNDAGMKGRDPRECGERVIRACLAEAGGSSTAAMTALACEKRRSDAWGLRARQAYRQVESKLGDADKRLLRTSQVQFELELRDLCAATRSLPGGDPELAAAACASDLVAARALTLARLAAGKLP
ncbi:hypothetical protein SAMN05519103_01830 [Rhizobiales bacterium GAS113]|nr:hypothetical protein SAMN05519103_01830 [Rhizobiales bacterium GAS113]